VKTIGITDFKSNCAQLLESVQQSGEPLVVTSHRRPLVTVSPYRAPSGKRRLGALRGRMTIEGDIVHTDLANEWEMET